MMKSCGLLLKKKKWFSTLDCPDTNLYWGQEATVKTEEYGETEWFTIGKGVRQECINTSYENLG